MGKKSRLKWENREKKQENLTKKKIKKPLVYAIIAVVVIAILGMSSYELFFKNIIGKNNVSVMDLEKNKQTNKIATIETEFGNIQIELFPDVAPKTVENFVKLAEKGYYDGIKFHRVIKDFMIQTGDPTGTGTGGESAFGKPFEDEINPWALDVDEATIKQLQDAGYKYNKDLKSMKNTVGAIAMANSGPNTNGSQFFIITEQDQPHLNGRHTVFGRVIEGMDVVKKIAAVEVDSSDKPKTDVVMKKVTIKDVESENKEGSVSNATGPSDTIDTTPNPGIEITDDKGNKIDSSKIQVETTKE